MDSLYQRILENLTSPVLLFDSQLCLSYINPAGEMLFAVSAKRLLQAPLASLLEGNNELLEELRLAQLSRHPFTKHEIEIALPLGRQVTVDFTVTPLTDSPQPGGLLVEVQELDRHLRISREESQFTQQQAIRALVRGLAHEVKNPLGGLRGAAQLLARELPSAALREYTNIIIGEADRLQQLVDRMLGSNTPPKRDDLNIHQVLEYVRQLVLVEISGHIQVVRDYDPSLPDVYADRGQLIQVVLNIVRNAVQALIDGGDIIMRTRPVRQFTIGQKRHRLVCLIEIIDNGPGIPDDLIENIFFPMVTGRAEGSGLGLSIAQSLVNQHGGLIQCASRPGRTVFSIYLPLNNPERTA
jgi:two-component system nitrogen regulation sensor histidine kinase GlnL